MGQINQKENETADKYLVKSTSMLKIITLKMSLHWQTEMYFIYLHLFTK